MNAKLRRQVMSSAVREQPSGKVSLLLPVFGVPCVIWSFFILQGSMDLPFAGFYVAAAWFVVLAMCYLGLHGLTGIAWCSLPVLLTLRALLEMVGLPAWRFATDAEQLDSVYVHSMFLVLLGFGAFWMGSLLLLKRVELRYLSSFPFTPRRTEFMAGAMFVLGIAGNLVRWKAGLLSFTGEVDIREASLPFMQWLVFFTNLLKVALVVSAIEFFGKRNTGPFLKTIFWLSLISTMGFGAISGMKSEFLMSPLLVLLVYCITRGRVPRWAILIPVLYLVINPFAENYRANLMGSYYGQARTAEGLGEVLAKSFDDVVDAPLSASERAGGSLDAATSRLSVLSSIHDVIGLPDPSQLNGDEKVWMAPIYPLVPRFLWKDKPVLNKGQRVSIALGLPSTTASAITPIADLYSIYGTYGVPIGMLIYGMGLQLFMNWIGRNSISEQKLFVFLSLLLGLINLEGDVVSLIAGAVQNLIVFVLLSYFIYGLATSQSRLAKYSSSREAA